VVSALLRLNEASVHPFFFNFLAQDTDKAS